MTIKKLIIRLDRTYSHRPLIGLHRISGLPDIRPFLLSGIRPDIRLQVPDIRPIIMKKITEF